MVGAPGGLGLDVLLVREESLDPAAQADNE